MTYIFGCQKCAVCMEVDNGTQNHVICTITESRYALAIKSGTEVIGDRKNGANDRAMSPKGGKTNFYVLFQMAFKLLGRILIRILMKIKVVCRPID